jgi:hypothetical protein
MDLRTRLAVLQTVVREFSQPYLDLMKKLAECFTYKSAPHPSKGLSMPMSIEVEGAVWISI